MSEERQFQTCLLGYEMLADSLSATTKDKIAPKCYQIQQDFETASQLGVISTSSTSGHRETSYGLRILLFTEEAYEAQ